MKKIVVLLVLVIVSFFACKKQIIEPVVEKSTDDTIIVQPSYWCVKSAVYTSNFGPKTKYTFEYDEKSFLRTTRMTLYSNGDSTLTTTKYEYEGGKLKSLSETNPNTSINYEEVLTYENGRIMKKIINGQIGISSPPFIIDYNYYNGRTNTNSYGPTTDSYKTDTLLVDYRLFQDSIQAKIRESGERKYYTESWEKHSGKLRFRYNNTTLDSMIISKRENKFNPLIWRTVTQPVFYQISYQYAIKSVLLDTENNVLLIDTKSDTETTYKYVYDSDSQGRITKVKTEVLSTNSAAAVIPTFELNLYY